MGWGDQKSTGQQNQIQYHLIPQKEMQWTNVTTETIGYTTFKKSSWSHTLRNIGQWYTQNIPLSQKHAKHKLTDSEDTTSIISVLQHMDVFGILPNGKKRKKKGTQGSGANCPGYGQELQWFSGTVWFLFVAQKSRNEQDSEIQNTALVTWPYQHTSVHCFLSFFCEPAYLESYLIRFYHCASSNLFVRHRIQLLALAETVQAKLLVARSMTAEAKAQYVALLWERSSAIDCDAETHEWMPSHRFCRYPGHVILSKLRWHWLQKLHLLHQLRHWRASCWLPSYTHRHGRPNWLGVGRAASITPGYAMLVHTGSHRVIA